MHVRRACIPSWPCTGHPLPLDNLRADCSLRFVSRTRFEYLWFGMHAVVALSLSTVSVMMIHTCAFCLCDTPPLSSTPSSLANNQAMKHTSPSQSSLHTFNPKLHLRRHHRTGAVQCQARRARVHWPITKEEGRQDV